jgi:hypothetical protein
MTIDANVLSSQPVESLCEMYAAEYVGQPIARIPRPLPAMLNALGACAGFASQVAVWRELILPANRNPGDFLAYAATKAREIFFFGEAINQFLFSTGPDRLSFLSLAASTLASASELPDIGELAAHVARSVGDASFGRPRVPPSVDLPEFPQPALIRTWGSATKILHERRPSEWPALFGAAANNIVNSNRTFVPPPIALRIMLEAAVPMSKLNPALIEDSGVRLPSLTNWSMRAVRPENVREIVAEVRAVMPAMPPRISARPRVISSPKIVFLNLSGASGEAIAARDQAEIGIVFRGNVETATVPVPSCDVLFLYCDFEPSSKIVGHEWSLRNLIRESKASVAVVASQVPHQIFANSEFHKSIGRDTNPRVNLVITGNRNGDAFGRFFKSLFELMWNGVSMPMAWVTLAPQGPQQPDDIPGTIFIPEAGQVVFGERRAWEGVN